jgi:hypothetical protein
MMARADTPDDRHLSQARAEVVVEPELVDGGVDQLVQQDDRGR